MNITKYTLESGTKGIFIEVDGRGADFYDDGTYYGRSDSPAMFRRCIWTGNIIPYVRRSYVRTAFRIAKKELGVSFKKGLIGVYVDDDGNVSEGGRRL